MFAVRGESNKDKMHTAHNERERKQKTFMTCETCKTREKLTFGIICVRWQFA